MIGIISLVYGNDLQQLNSDLHAKINQEDLTYTCVECAQCDCDCACDCVDCAQCDCN